MNLVYASKWKGFQKSASLFCKLSVSTLMSNLFLNCAWLLSSVISSSLAFHGHLCAGCKIFRCVLKGWIKGFDTHELPASWLLVPSSFLLLLPSSKFLPREYFQFALMVILKVSSGSSSLIKTETTISGWPPSNQHIYSHRIVQS